ncbi:TRAP transporter small permease [Thalassobius vesicularis]|uniref:TRAP transporter small permease protein n=1 Tax=Thalassobius vesicularis TaxID=1294297 RepID=A0A4S3MCW0_9RHOB|nr:TRAP transporter small permease [Thalassobius vesicularis]THD76287.1 TRAP transporter small permease [Thalassobius vesicularis]
MLNLLRLAERTLLVTIFLTMAGLFFLSVVTREIGGTFASQFAWIEEAVRIMNTFLVFLGLGLALERGRHVGIDSLRERLPERFRSVLLKAIDAIGFGFSMYLAWLGYGLAQFVLKTGQRSPTLDIPMGYVYLAPIIGFALLGLRFGLSFFGVIDRFSKSETEAVEA